MLQAAAAETHTEGRIIWWFDILSHWDAVHLDLMEKFGVNLHDPAVLASPWLGIRPLILGLIHEPSRLSYALRKE